MNLVVVLLIALGLAQVQSTARGRGLTLRLLLLEFGLVLAAVLAVSKGSSFAIDFAWWKELGQTTTFWRLLAIEWLPQTLVSLAAFGALSAAFGLARRRAASRAASLAAFGAAGYGAAAIGALLLGFVLVDPWTLALGWAGGSAAGAYRDPLFGNDLGFYFFRLPVYEMAAAWLGALCIASLGLYAATLAVGSAAMDRRWPAWLEEQAGEAWERPSRRSRPGAAHWAPVLRAGAALFLFAFAATALFGRYHLLYSQHRFLYGADYVDAKLGVPLLWLRFGLCAGLGLLVLGVPSKDLSILEVIGEETSPLLSFPRWLAPAVSIGFFAALVLPPLVQQAVRSLVVQPNELTLERPYIVNHIGSTLDAYNLGGNAREEPFNPRPSNSLDVSKYPDVARNILLWDREPFRDNVTQLQTLRPYYAFPSVDTDRYSVGGERRQFLIAARTLETDLLPEKAQTWVNLNLQYTHGYGAVAALVDSATEEGAPNLSLKDAPPRSSVSELEISRPQIYFGEDTSQNVFVDSNQQEFDYPKGDDNSYSTYDGSGGIPVGSPLARTAAALTLGDWNILLTRYLTASSKLLLHRQLAERVGRLAPFLLLDPDACLVIDGSGRLFWLMDGYTSSNLYPNSQPLSLGTQEINYIRSSVKITVDAYNGTVRFYVFDDRDPLLGAYRKLFPGLFSPREEMPKDLLAHIRYPGLMFRAQAETYRTFHMRDPQVFYNKEDQWDVAKQVAAQDASRLTDPYYVMVRLPGDERAEFLLMLPFTSHNRDNLIAWIAARCDPEHYGEVIFYRLPKEQLIYGPLQIQSRVDQDREISKDLSLWNQQGSRVVRGNTRVLPVGDTFLYVEPIYIQATQAQLPELKKVVLGVGDRLVYSDNLGEALAELARPGRTAPAEQTAAAAAVGASAALQQAPSGVLRSLKEHMDRYRELTSRGHLSEAGKELELIEQELGRNR